MAKIENDKYYTPDCLAEYCVNKAKEIIGEEKAMEDCFITNEEYRSLREMRSCIIEELLSEVE